MSDSECETCLVQEYRIQALHANSASCMAENIRLKAENAGLRGSLEAAQRRPASTQKVGDFASLWRSVSALERELRYYATEDCFASRVAERLDELKEVLEGWEYCAKEDT